MPLIVLKAQAGFIIESATYWYVSEMENVQENKIVEKRQMISYMWNAMTQLNSVIEHFQNLEEIMEEDDTNTEISEIMDHIEKAQDLMKCFVEAVESGSNVTGEDFDYLFQRNMTIVFDSINNAGNVNSEYWNFKEKMDTAFFESLNRLNISE